MTEIDSNQFQLVVSKKTKKKLKQGLNAKFRGNTFKAEATTMKLNPAEATIMKLNPELSDCVMAYIFSMLSLKDLVKTSALSRRWIHEWRLRMDLNFDLHNMFDYNTIQDMSETLILSQFTTKLDQFMLHYQGPVIRSIRVDFPLGKEHTHVVNRLISKGIAMGVQRIDLLFRSNGPIELASNLLRNASSLKEMTFNARDKFYIGSDRWTNDSNGCGGFEQNDIHEMLKDEVNEQCQLIIL